MRKIPREAWLAGILFVALVAVTVVTAVAGDAEAEQPVLSSLSNQPEGARALALWLDALGYSIENSPQEAFAIPEGSATALLLEPFTGITPSEWLAIDHWIDRGGTLIAAGEGGGFREIARHFHFDVTYSVGYTPTVEAQSPLVGSPVIDASLPIQTSTSLLPGGSTGFIPHLADGQQIYLASFEQGAGRVILAAFSRPFSNQGLKETAYPALVANVLALARNPGLVWFDEWHHGIRSSPAALGPESWLRRTPIGRSILFSAALVFLALFLQGRNFGRPLSATRQARRRGPLEQVTALANLSRRAGHRQAVLQQYHQDLKRQLGQRYRLDPSLPDADYVARLAGYQPDLDAPALTELLRQLSVVRPTEEHMINWAAKAAEKMHEVG